MDNSFSRLFDKTLRFLSFRQRSELEIKQYLKKNKAADDDLQKILEKLKELKFIDDKEFAVRFIEDRISYHPKSQKILGLELKRKGIAKEIIDEVLSGAAGDNSIINAALKKALRKYHNLPMPEKKKKLIAYLAARGFEWDIIKTAIDEILGKE